MTRLLGKQAAVPDPRVPSLKAVMETRAPPPPSSNWYAGVGEWPLLANDIAGDCVPAGALHCIAQRMTYAGKPVTFSDKDALDLYSQWTGYNPDDPLTDNGTLMSDAMARWARDGIALPDGGLDKPTAYVTVNHKSLTQLRLAIAQCGSVMMGINCPEAWLETKYLMDILDSDMPTYVGGHCILLVGYLPTDLGVEFDVISWGYRYRMTWRAMQRTADEAYAILDPDWLDKDGVNPGGVAWEDAEAAMAQIRAA